MVGPSSGVRPCLLKRQQSAAVDGGSSSSKPLHVRQRSQRSSLVPCAAASSSGMRMRDMSRQLTDARQQMEENEDLKVLMAGLRGSNLNTDDFAAAGVRMQLVEVDEDAEESLPKIYNPDRISEYWDRRPVAVATRIAQLSGIAGGFVFKLLWDLAFGRLKETEVQRAIDMRNILTSLGPAYIKLGQALSIRPDLLSPAAMNEMQQLCDKVPSFPNELAMATIEAELGKPWYEVYAELSPDPIAAASLGQVYRGRLKTGEEVAVKVQRPYVLETVTVDLYIIRNFGLWLRTFPSLKTDVVALLDEWAARFFEELDYVQEGANATLFAEQMKVDLPQVVVPTTYEDYTSRRVLTISWLEGEKLSQSKADDVGTLVNVGVICYLKQLLDTGFFHADPHPGNLIRTPDGRLAILDFGLMTKVDDNIKFGMIEAISHLIHRDYEAIVEDFVTLDFIPPGTDLKPILPVLAKVFDQALEGGGAKSINFQELAADLAEITFNYPFRIPPYFALIIRAISVLEGIALTANPDFAIVDEAYPYISQRLLTDDSPRLRESLRYMVYGKNNVFDAERIVDLLDAFEDFAVSSRSAQGDLEAAQAGPSGRALPQSSSMPDSSSSGGAGGGFFSSGGLFGTAGVPALGSAGMFGFPGINPALVPGMALLSEALLPGLGIGSEVSSAAGPTGFAGTRGGPGGDNAREGLKFMFSSDGQFFREFLMDELVKSVDALSREQLATLVGALGLQAVRVPVLLPGSSVLSVPLSPEVTPEDKQVVKNLLTIINWLSGGRARPDPSLAADFLPYVPALATEVLPDLMQRLTSRIIARGVRELYLPAGAQQDRSF